MYFQRNYTFIVFWKHGRLRAVIRDEDMIVEITVGIIFLAFAIYHLFKGEFIYMVGGHKIRFDRGTLQYWSVVIAGLTIGFLTLAMVVIGLLK